MIVRARLLALLLGSVALAVTAVGCGSDLAGSALTQDASAGVDGDRGPSYGTGGSTGSSTGGRTSVDAGAVGTGGSTSAGSGGAAAGTGGAGGAPGCTVALTPVSVPSFADVESGPDAKLRIKGTITNGGTRTPTWTWIVIYQGSPSMEIPTVRIDDATVEFPVKAAGPYEIRAQANTGVAVCGSGPFYVTAKVPCPRCFRFRVTPPGGGDLGIPPQEVRVDVANPGAQAGLDLDAGSSVSVAPQDPAGRYLPAYVRVSGVSAGLTVEGHTARGPLNVWLLPAAVYDVLVIPDGAWAPMLLSTTRFVANPLPVDQGTPVTGQVLDSGGRPVVGARVVLRAGSRPSTIGVSDADGQFLLLARPGTLSAVIAPPATSGLPEAHVGGSPANPGMVLDVGAGGLDLSMTWNPVVRGSLSVTARTSDGAEPATGVRVRVESEAELPAVGVLRAEPSGGTAVTLTATGSIRLDLDVDDAGLARFPSLPVGSYKVTLVPAVASLDAALTTAHVTLTAAGFAGTLPLGRRVMINGTLLPAAGTNGVRVIARDQSTGIVAEVAAAVAGDQGRYTLSVDPDRRYQLTADPPAGSGLARTLLAEPIDVGAADTTAPDFTVTPAVSFKSIVRRPSTTGSGTDTIAGAVVQVFCVASSLGCRDALAETVSGGNGQFTVALPAAITAATIAR